MWNPPSLGGRTLISGGFGRLERVGNSTLSRGPQSLDGPQGKESVSAFVRGTVELADVDPSVGRHFPLRSLSRGQFHLPVNQNARGNLLVTSIDPEIA
jgi:hypothetical protein